MVVATVRVIFFGEGSVLATEVEVEFSWVSFGLVGGDIFDLQGAFVAVVVEMDVDNLELEEAQSGVVLYFFVAFESDVSRKMSSVGECSFGMVMREDFFLRSSSFLMVLVWGR